MNLSRLVLLCAALVGSWIFQVIGMARFQSALISGPPQFKIVDFDDWPKEDLEAKDWDLNQPFTSQESANEQIVEFHREKWLSLLAAIFGIVATFFTAYLVFENKGFALASVFGGPLCVAYFLARNSWR
ncbi:MAG: hypothetical protein ACJAVK_001177 [Akkermansiaceae bacterium]|jgi:hypothetical protein